ncbi:MAG: Ig-like domain-containing protein [Acidobacteriota bacterium]
MIFQRSAARHTLSFLALFLVSTLAALAQGVGPAPPERRGDLPIGSACTAEILNFTATAAADGRVTVRNVPADRGLIRLLVTCIDAQGNTTTGQSSLEVPVDGGSTVFDDITFDGSLVIPQGLAVAPQPVQLVGTGTTQQLTVTATLSDGSVVDVTAASAGTSYRSSNEAVATVDGEGLLTAVGSGSTVIIALNEGRPGLTLVSVLSAALTGLEVTPAAVELVPHALFSAPTAQLTVDGRLADTSTVDLTPAATGTTYVSSDDTVAQVTEDGLVVGLDGGAAGNTATITVSNGTHTVPVEVDVAPELVPEASVTFPTPGSAENVDVEGALIFVADQFGGLGIYDFEHGYLGQLTFAGGRPALDARVRGDLVAVGLGSSGGIALVDASDPTAPSQLALVTDSGTVPDLWFSGDRVYAAAAGDLAVYDVSDPAAPSLLGSQSFNSTVRAVAGDSARGLVVALTSQPALEVVRTGARPWDVVNVPLPRATSNAAEDVFLLGTSAYIANGFDGVENVGRLHAVDVADPANPRLRASGTLRFNALGVAARSTARGPIVGGSDNIFINSAPLFDEELRHLHTVDFPGDTTGRGIALGNGYGVVAGGHLGIQVFSTDEVTDNRGEPPTVTLIEPTNGDEVVAGVVFDIRALATDDVEVATVEFLVEEVVVATDESEPWSTSYTFPPGTTGLFGVRAEAIDSGGNRGVSQDVTVSVVESTADPGAILSHAKVTHPGLGGQCMLSADDRFGRAVASLGDLDGAGPSVRALAVGASRDDDGGTNRGAVCILFLDATGGIESRQKISDTEGQFSGVLADADFFGTSLAALDDLDGDGVADLAVGAPGDDDGGSDQGAVWLLFLNPDGTVKSHQKVSATAGGFTGTLEASDLFGTSVAFLGHLDGSALSTLAVGAILDDDGSVDIGAVWLLFLRSDGSVDHHQKISATAGGFAGPLNIDDNFGAALASMADLDGDGVTDLAVGAIGDSDAGFFRGAVWVLFLNPDGSVKGHQKINDTQGGFLGALDDFDLFGASLARIDDLNGDGLADLAVGALLDDDGGSNRGAVWILFLDVDSTVKGHKKLSSTSPSFPAPLADSDNLGASAAALGDLDGDGVTDLAVGADRDGTNAVDAGAVWIFFLDGEAP